MSLHEYRRAVELKRADEPFYALVMAAIMRADSNNLARFAEAFPETYYETLRRYNAPGGVLSPDGDEEEGS